MTRALRSLPPLLIAAITVGVGFLALVIILLLGPLGPSRQVVATPPTPSVSTSPIPAQPDCGPERPSYNYTDAPKGKGPEEKENNNSFGMSAIAPTNVDKVDWTSSDIRFRLLGEPKPGGRGGDWRLLTALKSKVDGTDKNMTISSFAEWCRLVTDFVGRMRIVKVEKLYLHDGPYTTMSMTRARRADDLPTVNDVKVDGGDSEFAIAAVKMQGSSSEVYLSLRLRCGYQPYDITLG